MESIDRTGWNQFDVINRIGLKYGSKDQFNGIIVRWNHEPDEIDWMKRIE